MKKLRVILDTNALLDIFEGATTKHIEHIVRAIARKVSLPAGRTGRISRTQLEELDLVLRRDFLPAQLGRRFLTVAGLVPGGVPRVTVYLTQQVADEYISVLRRQYAAQGRSADEAEKFALMTVKFLTLATRGQVDPRSGEQCFRDLVEANCREAGRTDRQELFSWNRRDLGRVDESAILLAVLDRDEDAVLVTADAKASARARERGAEAYTVEEVCKDLENTRRAA